MFKKYLSIIAAVTITASSIVGCGQQASSPENSAASDIAMTETENQETMTSNSESNTSANTDAATSGIEIKEKSASNDQAAPANDSQTGQVANDQTTPAANTQTGDFDTSVYEKMNWKIGDMGQSMQLKVNGYYGDLTIEATEQGMHITTLYNMGHLAEIKGNTLKAESGNQVELFIANSGRLYLYDAATNKNDPTMFYVDGDGSDSSSMMISKDDLNISQMFGDDIAYTGYKEAVEINGKTVDVCNITLKNDNGEIIPCEAYVDRDSQTLQKIEKEKDANNKYDYSMTIQAMQGDKMKEPEWIKGCKVATDDQMWDLFGIFMGMGIIMSDKEFDPEASMTLG